MAKEKTLEQLVEQATTKIALHYYMFARVLMEIGGVNVVDDETIPAMAYTNGKGIFINKHYIENVYQKEMETTLNANQYMFLICHELGHLINMTFDRQGNRNPQVWNMATDFNINSILLDNRDNFGAKSPMGEFIIGGLYDPNLLGLNQTKTCEQIYDELMKLPQNNQQNQSNGNGNSDSQQDNNGNGSGNQQDNNQQDNGNGNSGNQLDKTDKQQMSGKYNLDDHDQYKKSTQQELAQLSTRIEKAIKECGKEKCLAVDRLLDERPQPKFNWKGALGSYLRAMKDYNTTWKTPSRRGISSKVYLPSADNKEHLDIVIGIDTSGSIDDKTLANFYSHLQLIMKTFNSYTLELHCFSTQVHKETIIKLNEMTAKHFNIKDYKVQSFGGTDIKSSFDYVASRKDECDIFLCFTDGCDNIDNLTYEKTPVLWCITGNDTFVSPKGVKRARVIPIDNDND